MLQTDPVSSPTPPSEDIFRLKKNFWALQASRDLISVVWAMK